MLWLGSYLGANGLLVIVVILAIAALGGVAFLAKSWKLAVIAVIVLGAGLAYQWIDRQAYQRRVDEEARARVTALEQRIATMNWAAEEDAKRASADADRIAALEGLVNDTPANADRCLDRDAAGRVRAVR
jgi:cadmium resistance protein CadD (predicted permease)